MLCGPSYTRSLPPLVEEQGFSLVNAVASCCHATTLYRLVLNFKQLRIPSYGTIRQSGMFSRQQE